MGNEVVKERSTWRKTMVAALSGLAVLGVATAALAHDDDEGGWKHHGRHFVPPGHVYYYAAPVYSPRPVVVYPAPVYYEPVPAYYPPPGLNLNFNIPLR